MLRVSRVRSDQGSDIALELCQHCIRVAVDTDGPVVDDGDCVHPHLRLLRASLGPELPEYRGVAGGPSIGASCCPGTIKLEQLARHLREVAAQLERFHDFYLCTEPDEVSCRPIVPFDRNGDRNPTLGVLRGCRLRDRQGDG
jgi:hypothetical protein